MEKSTFTSKRLTFKPVTEENWTEMQTLFSEPGSQKSCWCMYWRLKRIEFNQRNAEGRRLEMEQIIHSGRVPGILAYHEGQPVGWCSVAPRDEFPVLDRSWTLKRVDEQPVWSIVCFFVSPPYRGQGLGQWLIKAAVDYAREQGARIIEAYPLDSRKAWDAPVEGYMGLVSTFEKAGFQVVIQRSHTRSIMRCTVTDST